MQIPVVAKGAGLGVVNTLVTYPFDTLKVYSQANGVIYSDFFDLYRGCGNKILWNTFLSGIIFWVRDLCVNNKNFPTDLTNTVSGIFSSFFVHISDVNKIQQQLELKGSSIKFYFSTLFFTMAKETLQSVIFFNSLNSDGNFFLVTIFTGFITSFVIYPLDTLRTKKIVGEEDVFNIKVKEMYDGYLWYCAKTIVSAFVIKLGSHILNLV